jgi:hypothetical protein
MNHLASVTVETTRRRIATLAVIASLFVCTVARAQPSDEQVIADAVKNKNGLIEATCTAGKTGEAYFHSKDKAFYWDRGVVIKRKAGIDGAPDAVVIVRGLARYNFTSGSYSYKQFLTTSNEYTGIPAPSSDDLLAYVKKNLKQVFALPHNITEVKSVAVSGEPNWKWHTAIRFTVDFDLSYKEIVSYTDVAEIQATYSITFYRKDLNSTPHTLMVDSRKREERAREKFTAAQVKQMPTLANQ